MVLLVLSDCNLISVAIACSCTRHQLYISIFHRFLASHSVGVSFPADVGWLSLIACAQRLLQFSDMYCAIHGLLLTDSGLHCKLLQYYLVVHFTGLFLRLNFAVQVQTRDFVLQEPKACGGSWN